MPAVLAIFGILMLTANFTDSNVYSQCFILAILLLILGNLAVNLLIRRQIEVQAAVIGGSEKGRDTICEISLINRSKVPVAMAVAHLNIINTYTQQQRKHAVKISAMPGARSTVKVRIGNPHCGKVACRIEKVTLKDVFGIVPIKTSAKTHCNYTVLPDTFDVSVDYELHESDLFDCETYSPYRKGTDPSEVFQLREYADGDSLKQIHWKLSGKLDTMIVKDASLPLDKSIMVVMDKASNEMRISSEAADAVAEITVSVCSSLMEMGLMFQLVWNDTAEQNCHCRQLQFHEEFAGAIPQLLTGAIVNSDESCGRLYHRLLGSSEATHVIYISWGQTADAEECFPKSKVINVDASTPGYREELRQLQLY